MPAAVVGKHVNDITTLARSQDESRWNCGESKSGEKITPTKVLKS